MNNNILHRLPMPEFDGPEPVEIELMRIQKMIENGQFDELSKEHQRWVTRRLMPSLARYGTYPPPENSE